MAYYFDEEDNPNNQQTSVEASKQSSVLPNGQIAPETAAAGTATANNARTNPGNFVGISQYLDANKPQAQKLANQVAGEVTDAANTARNDLTAKVANTQKDIAANTINYDQGAIDQLNQDASKADFNKIQGMKNATYAGPDSLGSIDSLANAQQAAKNVDTEAGRNQLVGNLYQNKPLKKGAQLFDNLLLQSAPGSQKTLQDAKRQADISGLEKNLADQQAIIAGQVNDARTTTANTARDTGTAITKAQQAFETALNGRVKQQQQAAAESAQATLDRLTGKLPQNSLTGGQDLSLLGINQDQYERLLKGIQGGYVDPNALGAVIRDPSNINAGNVASAEDYARYNVLKQLAGGGSLLGDDASQAGTFNPDLLDFNFVEPVVPTPSAPPSDRVIKTDEGGGLIRNVNNNTNNGVDNSASNALNNLIRTPPGTTPGTVPGQGTARGEVGNMSKESDVDQGHINWDALGKAGSGIWSGLLKALSKK